MLYITVLSLLPGLRTTSNSTRKKRKPVFHICEHHTNYKQGNTLPPKAFFKNEIIPTPKYLLLCMDPKSLYSHIVNQTREYIQLRRYSQGLGKMCSQPDFSPAYPLRYSSSSASTSWRETGAHKEQPVMKT